MSGDGSRNGGRSGTRIPDEELLADLRRVAEDLGESPTMADVDERGAYSPSTYQSRFGSWTGAKERAGLSTGRVEYADAELLDDLRAFADEVGESPTRAQMRDFGPHAPSTYADRFGSWTDALAEADLEGRGPTSAIPEADLLTELRRVTDQMGRCPTSEEFDDRGRYSAATYFRRFDSWDEALDRTGVADDYPSADRRRLSDDELAAELQRLADALGRPPTGTEMADLGDHSPETYRKRFGSWAEALRTADLDPDLRPSGGEKRRIPTAKLIADVRRVAETRGRAPTVREIREHGAYGAATYLDRFGSWNRVLGAAGLDPRRYRGEAIPTRNLVRELRSLAVELGRRPRRAEMERRGSYAGMTYYNRFGSWDEAVEAAGITVEDGSTTVSGYCDACGDGVDAPVTALPGDEGLFCDDACREVGTRASVEFESDVLDAAEGDHLGRLAEALSGEDGTVLASRVLTCLGHAVELADGGFSSAAVEGYDLDREGDIVTVAWEEGTERRELRVAVPTLEALARRMDERDSSRADDLVDRRRPSVTDD